ARKILEREPEAKRLLLGGRAGIHRNRTVLHFPGDMADASLACEGVSVDPPVLGADATAMPGKASTGWPGLTWAKAVSAAAARGGFSVPGSVPLVWPPDAR